MTSSVQCNGERGKEVKKRVQAGLSGWRKVSGVICDKRVAAKVKGKVYKTTARSSDVVLLGDGGGDQKTGAELDTQQ